MSEELWQLLADEQWCAACKAPIGWPQFIQKCERLLGLPWNEIRERFDAIYRSQGRTMP